MGYVSFEQKRQKAKQVALWTMCGILFVAAIVLAIVLAIKTGSFDKIGSGSKNKNDVLKPGATATAAPTAEPTPVPYDWVNEEENTIATRFNAPE